MQAAQIELAPPELIAKYEPVIGLEVHCQLATHTKIFCGCPAGFGALPNTHVCPVCLALPGALPVLNREAVELALKAALALNCTVNPLSRFARKNYFYPDSPKGYQISQFDQPLCEHGHVGIVVNATPKRIGVTRIHMEDDAGKSQHDGFRDSTRFTYVDLNRSGTPLIEIVSEPDMRSADEAVAYFAEVKQVLQFVGVSTCDMEKGHLRCDANVSVRLKGAEKFGIRAEVKNLNSFRFLKLAIDYEIARQVALAEGGGHMFQETRLFDPEAGETVGMRSKEDAHDYRYFPEPDLVPLRVSEAWLAKVRAGMPELPAVKRRRFIEQYGLSEYDADVLTQSRAIGEYYNEAANVPDPRKSGEAASRSVDEYSQQVAEVYSLSKKIVANWVTGDLFALLNRAGKNIGESPVIAKDLGELLWKVHDGDLSIKQGKEVLEKMFETGETADVIVERECLHQISDSGALGKIVDEVIAANPKQVEQFRSGKTAVIGFLVGQAMKLSRGQANPAAVNELLKSKL